MASNKPAPEAPTRLDSAFGADFGPGYGAGPGYGSGAAYGSDHGTIGMAAVPGAGLGAVDQGGEPDVAATAAFSGVDFRVDGDSGSERGWEEWNPTEESVRPVRGRHRVTKQRSGLARSSAVLGVGVIAAVGAGGMATAQGKPPVSISLPDAITDKLPDAKSLPGVGSLLSDDSENDGAEADTAPLTTAGITTAEAEQGTTDAGEALRARILQQAEQQQAAADAEAREAQERAAAEKAAAEAKKQQDVAEAKAAAEKKKAEEARKKAEEEARKKAEALRLAKLAASYAIPTSSYTITSTYGQAGTMWASGHHTGLDFAAPTGTPVKAVHGGTITSAGWSGSYGYRTVLELEDGTEVWYCHQSSIGVGIGQKVSTGETIGRVGATGNVTGPHLHLEVHTADGTGVDPMSWLRGKGLNI